VRPGATAAPEVLIYAAGGAAQKPRYRPVAAARAVAYATSLYGKPYCWGGTGPHCYDCSGLTFMSWQAAGKPVPRTSAGQHRRLAHLPLSEALPGDIVWRPGHVGLLVGGGWAIHAPRSGQTVTYQRASRFHLALRP